MSNGFLRNDVLAVRGNPTAEELAAVVTMLRSRAGQRPHRVDQPSPWARSGRPDSATTHLPADRGPRVWRTAGRPGRS